jgi:competence protein ComEA
MRTSLIVLCVAIFIGGVVHRHKSHHPIPIPPGADSAQIALFHERAAIVPGSDPLHIKLDLNRANAHELSALPGIGPVRAAAIVEYRDSHGPFRNRQDLENVPGIGPKTIERVSAHIIVADSETLLNSNLRGNDNNESRDGNLGSRSGGVVRRNSPDESAQGLGVSLQLMSAPTLLQIYRLDSNLRGNTRGRNWNDLPFPSSPATQGRTSEGMDSVSAKININEATAEQLDALPGIGPVKAHAIVEYRQLHGLYRRPDDLLNVKGIGAKTLERIKPYITI